MRGWRVLIGLVAAACALALPCTALGATATVTAVESTTVKRAAEAPDHIPRFRQYFGTKVDLQGTITRDDGLPAAGVTVRIFRQVADATVTGGYRTEQVGLPLVTDPQGAFQRKVKPDRITYYYAQVDAQPELGLPTLTNSPQIGLLVAPRLVQTSDPRQKGANFRITGRILMAGARSLGTVVVERLKGQVASRVASTRAKVDGRFLLRLHHDTNGTYRYRLSFRPTDLTRLIASSIIFSIRVTSIEPPENEGTG